MPWGTCPRPRIPRDAARASQLGGATGYQLQRCLASPHPIIVVAPNQASSASLCKRSRLWAIHTTANLPIEMSDRACVFLSRRARAYPVSTFVPKTQPAAMRMTSRDGTCAWVFVGTGTSTAARRTEISEARTRSPNRSSRPWWFPSWSATVRGLSSWARGQDRNPRSVRAKRTGGFDVRRNDEAPHQHHH